MHLAWNGGLGDTAQHSGVPCPTPRRTLGRSEVASWPQTAELAGEQACFCPSPLCGSLLLLGPQAAAGRGSWAENLCSAGDKRAGVSWQMSPEL